MPAIGFAVLLKIMMKKRPHPLLPSSGFCYRSPAQVTGAGYCCAAALAMALIDLLRKSPEPTQPAAQKEEFEDGI